LPTAVSVGDAVDDYGKLEQHSGGRISLDVDGVESRTSTSTATGLGMNWYSDIPNYVTLGDECSAKGSNNRYVCHTLRSVRMYVFLIYVIFLKYV
jgi:hypothetical protein